MEGEEQIAAVLGALCARYGLQERQREQLGSLLDALGHDERAPTSVRDAERAVNTHVADALVALELAPLQRAHVLSDLGSGAGLPGLVLAAALPRTEVVLVESQARKCEFIAVAAALMGLENTRVACTRAEDWHAGMNRSDVAVARAVAAQPVVLEYAAPLLRIGGSLVDWRGRRAAREERAAAEAAAELGLRRTEIRRVEPFAGAREHHLHVFEKVAATPERFPRRAGIARKRPLRA